MCVCVCVCVMFLRNEDKKGVAGDTHGTSIKLKGKCKTHSLQALEYSGFSSGCCC